MGAGAAPPPMTPDALARRAEQAGLDASTPPQEQRVDGWLLRLSPGKAKRSRCVNALEAGTQPLPDLLARCRQAFANAGLPLIVRVTPYSQPADLDARLAALGWYRFDAADVMVRADLDGLPEAGAIVPVDATRYAETVGTLRGSSRREIDAHAERLRDAPRPYQGFFLTDANGALAACGQVVVDADIAGLFDVFTPPAQRGRGHGERLCSALLRHAANQCAQRAYLQVGSDNELAKRLYARLGFAFAYRYHYRSDDPAAAD
ncbi:MAG: GNAT family N-acetyltransferase [Pelomonas sp.]|nr:GNAT family N-acetyltransferase [Roseateles sp.]